MSEPAGRDPETGRSARALSTGFGRVIVFVYGILAFAASGRAPGSCR